MKKNKQISQVTGIRNTDFYKNLSPYTATGLAEGFVDANNEDEIIAAWQYLHDTRLAYQLQGWFGRNANHLVAEGIIED